MAGMRRVVLPMILLAMILLANWFFAHGEGIKGEQFSREQPGESSEKRLRNVRQLTFGGENAEAYFSSDDQWLIFQGHEGEESCDQIYTMDIQGGRKRLVSTGKGRTTCGYFYADGQRILYSSTHLGNEA